MTEILLIRHGETDWNVEKRLQGHLDIALNAEGKRQAAALGRVLLDEPLDAIIASDLQRAAQTAQAIAAPRGMTVHIESDLRERRYGALEGLRYSDINEPKSGSWNGCTLRYARCAGYSGRTVSHPIGGHSVRAECLAQQGVSKGLS